MEKKRNPKPVRGRLKPTVLPSQFFIHVKTLPINDPFLHSGHTYPLPLCTPTPSPQNQCCILDPQVFLLLQTTLIWGLRGFTAKSNLKGMK